MEAIPSSPDSRDWIAESRIIFKKSLPKKIDLRNDLQPVRSQGSQGTCVAQTGSTMKEWQEKIQINLDEYMSPQFIYNLRSNYPNAGMQGRDLMKILQKKGCCREIYFPYWTMHEKNKVSERALKDAKNFKIKHYAQVKTINGLKQVLASHGPCYIAFPVFNHGPSFWKPENSNQKQTGGHAVTVVGYNSKGFILRNSWGRDWAKNGYTIYQYKDFGMHWEIWSTIDDISNKVEPSKKGKCWKWWTFTKENI